MRCCSTTGLRCSAASRPASALWPTATPPWARWASTNRSGSTTPRPSPRTSRPTWSSAWRPASSTGRWPAHPTEPGDPAKPFDDTGGGLAQGWVAVPVVTRNPNEVGIPASSLCHLSKGPTQLLGGRCALRTLRGVVDAAGESGGVVMESEGVAAADEQGGRAAGHDLFGLLRRIDTLVGDREVEFVLRRTEPLVGQLPVRAAVEVLERHLGHGRLPLMVLPGTRERTTGFPPRRTSTASSQ